MVQSDPHPQTWVGEEGSTLRESVEAWGKKAGWRVIWDKAAEDIDYSLLAQVRFQGSFDEAASAFIKLYEKAKRKPPLVDIQAAQKPYLRHKEAAMIKLKAMVVALAAVNVVGCTTFQNADNINQDVRRKYDETNNQIVRDQGHADEKGTGYGELPQGSVGVAGTDQGERTDSGAGHQMPDQDCYERTRINP